MIGLTHADRQTRPLCLVTAAPRALELSAALREVQERHARGHEVEHPNADTIE